MIERIEWSLRQASKQYLEAKEEKKQAMWLNLYNQINRTMATYLRKQDIYVQQNTLNVETKVNLKDFIKALKEDD